MTVLLLSRGRVTAPEMAKRFEVSVRTIYRDIEAMNTAGIPIISYQGGGGGFGLIENFTLDRQLLSFDGMLSILTALRGINETLDDAALRDAIEKFRALLPEDKRVEADQAAPELVVDFSPWGMAKGTKERLSQAQQALSQRRLLSFDYQGAGAERRRRTVEPISIVFKGHGWYLHAYCKLREDYRLFRISRMRELKRESEHYSRRAATYHEPNFGAADSSQPQLTAIVLKFTPRMQSMVEDSFDPDSLEIASDGSVIARFEMPLGEWVYGMIESYGAEVEVLEPEAVRKDLATRLKNTLSIYEPDTGVSQG